MDRAELLEKLRAYRPADGNEAAMLERLTRFVELNAGCFDRSLPEGHVTGSAWILDLEGRHVLLTHHRRLDKWMQLGGHADGQADILAVALREAEEESGLAAIRPVSDGIFDVDVHEIPERRGVAAHFHYDIRYLLEADRGQPLTVSSESKDLAWVPVDGVERYSREESLLRMVRKTLRGGAGQS